MAEPGPVVLPFSGFSAAAVLIGASTGGPPLLERIVRALPADFPSPVAICQHMSPGFTDGWAQRLDPLSWLHIKEAENGERFERGTIYIAPAGYQLRFRRHRHAATIWLDDDVAGARFVPSIDEMFSSGADAFGSRAIGVLLTGLGSDGARGMLALRTRGAYTLIQRPDSAIAPSMPAAAAALNAAVEEVAADDLHRVIVDRAKGVFGTR